MAHAKLPDYTLVLIDALALYGMSTRQIAIVAQTNKTTVAKYILPHQRGLCACGRARSHGGRCRARMQWAVK